ncbi:MAG: type II toxin-antitoxin system HicB family antitoxin [bacterium]
MGKMRYVYWQHEDLWLGYLEEYPDYWTQGETREKLEVNLKDLWRDLTSHGIPKSKFHPRIKALG